MSIYLKKLEVTNFKSFPADKVKKFNFNGYNATIFDGPNGYGKSTVFDSLELLITGDIAHFESKLKNGYTTYLSIIANTDSLPTEITGYFTKGDYEFSVKRIFKWKSGNDSELIYTNEIGNSENINNQDIYELLNINENFFKIGMYISQNNSLLFLQEKYGKRKEILTSILDMKQIENRVKFVKLLKSKFNEKINYIGNMLQEKENKLLLERQSLKEIVGKAQAGEQFVNYKKLFPRNNFLFDSPNIDITIPIEKYEHQMEPIKKLVENYELFLETRRVKEIDEITNISQLSLKGFFYQDRIKKYSDQKQWWQQLFTLNSHLRKNTLSPEISSFELIKDKEINNKIKEYYSSLNRKNILEQSLKGDSSEIIKFNQKRKELKEHQKKQHIIDIEQCPFCGTYIQDLEESYNNLTDILETAMNDKQLEINKCGVLIAELESVIFSELAELLEPVKEELTLMNEIKDLQNLTEKEILNIEKFLPDFSNVFKETEDKTKSFEYLLRKFYEKLEEIKGNKNLFSDTEFFELDRIYNNIFENRAPDISSEDLDEKYLYIQSKYKDVYEGKLQKNKDEYRRVTHLLEKHNDAIKTNEILEVIKGYNDQAYKKYQEEFIKKIQLPLFLISGRIIQNYQLGLGIYAEVNSTQVVFKVPNHKAEMNTDIFNILSVGQLNGVIISILLSIRKIFSKESQLNLILIDDPLQSIDDVSSHSFADMLVEEFPNTQILLSTHEEDKSRLIQYKYQQLMKSTNNYNMQLEYLRN